MSIVICKTSGVGCSNFVIEALALAPPVELEPWPVLVDGDWIAPDVPVQRSGCAAVRACSESKYRPKNETVECQAAARRRRQRNKHVEPKA